MSAGTRPTPNVPDIEVPLDRFYRLSVDQYHRMTEAGILTKDDRVELIEGVIWNNRPASSDLSDHLYRLSVDQYDEMARVGILLDGEPVELIEGWLIVKMTKNPPHTVATNLVRDALSQTIPAGWFVASQDPITTFDSKPEPDVMVVRGHPRDYRNRHPTPENVGLIVEVADTSLPYDRTTKRRIYARAGVDHYWIINLIASRVEVYSEPTEAGEFRRREVFGRDADMPLLLDGREVGRIAVRDLLP
jgi:Uma2 family endonuclease